MSKKENKKQTYPEIKNFKELVERYKEYDSKVAFKFKQKGKVIDITYNKFSDDVRALGTAILNLGIDRIAVIGSNRYEWCTTYLGVTSAGKVIVPLDKALTNKEIEKLVKRSGAQAIVFEDKYKEAIENCDLEYKFCMDEYFETKGATKYKDLLQQGYDLLKRDYDEYDHVKIDNDKMAVMIFTSGTTNEPKAVMLSQNNLCSQISVLSNHIKLYTTDTLLSFLPMHHTFECMVTFLYGTYCGITVAFCDGIKYIAQNLKKYKITVFITVPLVLETMYKKIQKGIEASGKKELVDKMTKISNGLLKCKIDLRKKLFKAIREQFDEYLRLIIFGAASMDKDTIQGYLNLGIAIVQGYGLTENSPVVSVETEKNYRLGSVGKPLTNMEAKIENPDEEGIGEILLRGPSVMMGYYENEEATKKALDDEKWLHTGDFGYIDKDGYIFITGRKSDIIVLRNGKNIYPQELEFVINKLPYVEESMVYARNKSKTDTVLGAKIVYNKDEIIAKFGKQKDYKELVWEDIKEMNKELPDYKHIKEISLTDEPIEKTTTQKVKRFVEMKKIETSK